MEVLQGKVDCRPEETGYDSSRIEALNEHFQRLIDKEIIFGAEYTISHKGKVIANASLGKGSKIADVKMQPDTIFATASLTKVITSVAVMKLIEDGYLRLDSKASEVLPQFAEKPFDGITLLHLLTHTSGLYPDGGCFNEAVPDAWDLMDAAYRLWDRKGEFDWIKAGISGGLHYPTGTQWQYSSFCFVLLGEIITRVSGQHANDYIREKILKPLAMADTNFGCTTPEMAKRAFVRSEDEKKMFDAIIAGEPMENDDSFWSKLPGTAGGLRSTTNDLIRFANMLLGNGRLGDVRILGRKTVEKMTTQQLHNVPDHCWGADEPNRLYGVGFDMRQGSAYTYSQGTFMHEGAGASSLDIDPKEQLAAAWFVPWDKGEWCPDPLYNVQNIIWSGLI